MNLHLPKQNAQTEEPESKSSGRQVRPIESLRHHYKKAVLTAFVILLAGLPIAWMKGAPKYKAEGALFVSPRFLRNLDNDQEHEMQSNSQYREFVQQQVRTVSRYDIIEAALPASKDWQLPGEPVRRAVDRLRGAVQIASVPDTYQITVSLEGKKPEGLSELVNAVLESYIKTAHKELLFDSEARLKNLAEEQKKVEAEIDSLIEERTAIASELGTTVFSGAIVNSFDKQLGSSAEAFVEARRQRIVAEAALGPKADTAEGTALQNALSDNSLNGFKSALNTRKADLMVSISGLSAQHVARIAAEKEIQAIDREIEAVTASLRDRLTGNLRTLNRARLQQSSNIEQKLGDETSKIREQTETYSRSYQRSLEIGAELDRLRKRLHSVEDRISYLQLETRAPGFVRVFAPAMKPDLPFEGGRKKLFLIVFAAALALALILPLGLDFMDPRVREPLELEAHLGLPITGWLPKSAPMDAPALLRTAVSIRRHLHELQQRVLVISAVHHGGGSSTVSMGLACSLNRLGVKTLVIEANPLTPDTRYQSDGTQGGLLDWFSGRISHLPILESNGDLPDRIATGKGPLEDLLPIERLETKLAQEFTEWDLILIDAAPIQFSLVTEELVRVFGAALLVVDAQRDDRKRISKCIQTIERLKPPAFGAILNKVSGAAAYTHKGSSNDTTTLLAA